MWHAPVFAVWIGNRVGPKGKLWYCFIKLFEFYMVKQKITCENSTIWLVKSLSCRLGYLWFLKSSSSLDLPAGFSAATTLPGTGFGRATDPGILEKSELLDPNIVEFAVSPTGAICPAIVLYLVSAPGALLTIGPSPEAGGGVMGAIGLEAVTVLNAP